MKNLFCGEAFKRLPDELKRKREAFREEGVPSALTDTLSLLCDCIFEKKPAKILEIGTATGISGTAMLLTSEKSKLVTIEKDEDSFNEAKTTFENFGVFSRARQILGDAGDVINYLDDKFDFIFLDGAKARYLDYYDDLTRLLLSGGTLFADNVLFRGYVRGGVKFRHRENTIVRNMRDFLDKIENDKRYSSQIFSVGDGVLIAEKL